MDEQAAAKLGLKPSGLGRHEQPRICHGEQLVDSRGAHGERDALGAGATLELVRTANTANKADARV